MAIDALVKPLLHIELFQGLKPLQITEIARRADRIVYRPGEVIARENASADAAVVIVSGDAMRVSGPEVYGTPEPVPAGAMIAEMAMLIDTEHSSTIVARSTVRALRVSRSELHAQMSADPALADHFVQRIAGRLSSLMREMSEIDRALGHGDAATPATGIDGPPRRLPEPARADLLH